MRFASLGSGSAGNGLLVEEAGTRLLLDCGFGLRDTAARLARLGVAAESLTGIVITHEHDDHAGGAFKFANKYRIPVWMTHGTQVMAERYMPATGGDFEICLIDSHEAIGIQDIQLQPFPVPHDAREPVQYTFSNGSKKLGVLTDTGTSTAHIEQMLSGCDALVLECNHDLEMLMNGPYARPLKQRVNSRLGHLDNASSAQLLAKLDNSRLQHIIAAHLSAQNNHPQLAKSALSDVLSCDQEWIGIADQALGFDWREIA
jgi:phosphoribosyl 1,2-cyclic phosphodiesterase